MTFGDQGRYLDVYPIIETTRNVACHPGSIMMTKDNYSVLDAPQVRFQE